MKCATLFQGYFRALNAVHELLGNLLGHMFGHIGFSGGGRDMSEVQQVADELPYFALDVSWASDAGRVRGGNEDNFACDLETGVLVLADGMGGCQAGEVASAIAVSTVMQALVRHSQEVTNCVRYDDGTLSPVVTRMCSAVNLANQAVFEAAMLDPQLEGMGSTLVIAHFHEGKVTVANIGDSRLYLLRENSFQQLTVDHTVLQEEIDYGVPPVNEFQRIADGSTLTRALGVGTQITLDVFEQDIFPDDLFMLCSDGLYDMLSDDEMAEILLHGYDKNLSRAAQDLVEHANEKGGFDNITLILVKADPTRLTHS